MGTSDRTVDLTIQATDKTATPIRQALEQVTLLVAKLNQQSQANREGTASSNDYAKAVDQVNKVEATLLRQKTALTDFAAREATVDRTAANVDIKRGARDNYAASLPDETERTVKQVNQLRRLDTALASADVAAEKAGRAYALAAASLEKMGINATEVVFRLNEQTKLMEHVTLPVANTLAFEEAQHKLSLALKEVADASNAAALANRTGDKDRAAALDYVRSMTQVIKEQEKAERDLAQRKDDHIAAITTNERQNVLNQINARVEAERHAAEEISTYNKNVARRTYQDYLQAEEAEEKLTEMKLADLRRVADEQNKEFDKQSEQRRELAEQLVGFRDTARQSVDRAARTNAQVGAARAGATAAPNTVSSAVGNILQPVPTHFGSDIADADAAISKLNVAIEKGGVFATTYERNMETVAAVQRKIAGDATLIDNFNRQAQAVRNADAAFLEAGRALRDAATAVPSAAQSEGQLAQALARTETAYHNAGAEVQRQADKMRAASGALKAAKIDTADLIGTEARLIETSKRLAETQDKLSSKASGLFGLKPFELKNLEYRITDVYTQLSLGDGFWRTFNSQASKTFDIFDISIAGLLKLIPLAIAGAAALGAAYLVLQRYYEQVSETRKLTAQLAASVDGPLMNARNLAETRDAIEHLGLSFTEASAAVQHFVSEGINPDRMLQFARAAQDLADIYGTKFEENIKEVTSAFRSDFEAVDKLNEKYNFLTLEQYKHIRALYEQGDAIKGAGEALDLFNAKNDDAARLSKSSWQAEVRALKNEFKDFLDAIADTHAFQNFIDNLTIGMKQAVQLMRLFTGQVSADNYQKNAYNIGHEDATLGPKAEKLNDLALERRDTERKLSEARVLGLTGDTATLTARLEAINAEITKLKGEVGAEGLDRQLVALEARRDRLVREGRTGATEPSAPSAVKPGVPREFGAMRDRAATQAGIDTDAFARLQGSEGVLKDGKWINSPTGAIGPAQTIQSTFDAMKAKYKDITGNVHDEFSNLLAGAYYFREKLQAAGGDIKRATHLYHDGSALPGGPSLAATEQADKVAKGYTGVALQPNNLSAVDKQIEDVKRQRGLLPGAPAAAAEGSGPIELEDNERSKIANEKFARELRERLATQRDRNEEFGAAQKHIDEDVIVNRRRLTLQAEKATKGELTADTKAAIEEEVEFERKKRQEQLDKRIDAEKKRQEADQQTAINNLNAIQAKLDAQDKTNAAARRKAVDETYAKDFAQLDKAKKDGLTEIGGEPIEAFRKRLSDAVNKEKDIVSAEADVAAVEKIVKQRKAVFDQILKDEKLGIITIAEAFERMTKAAAEFAPRIAEAAKKARADLVTQGGSTPSPGVQESIAKIDAVRPTDATDSVALMKEGLQQLNGLQEVRNRTIQEQNILIADGVQDQQGAEEKIKAAYGETQGASEKLIASMREQLELLRGTPGFTQAAYDSWTAQLDDLDAKTKYVAKDQRDLMKTIESSVANRGVAAFEAAASSLARFASGGEKLKDLFADLGRAFGDFAAGVLKDVAAMIAKQIILNAVQGAMKGGGGGGGGGFGSMIASLMGSSGGAAGAAGEAGAAAGAFDGAGAAASSFEMAAAVAHGGGWVGSSGMSRRINPAAFANAVRMHAGGNPFGLASDEVPTILQRGENVMTASQMRNVANTNRPAAPQSVRNVMVFGDDEVAGAMAGSHGEKVILNHMKRNIPTLRSWIGG